MPFDVINAHHKLIRKASINVERMHGLTKQNTFRLSATAMNHTCLDHFVWKSSSKDRRDLFVSLNWRLLCSRWWQCLCVSGDGRWRQVIRRCASVSDTGVTGVCNWGVYENGVYWEECYCAEDSCNKSNNVETSMKLLTSTLLLMFIMKFLQS